jgi:hypothetical protein
MWYLTPTEAEQTLPPDEAMPEQPSDPIAGKTTIAGAKRALAATTPGSEYWLP